MNVALSEIQAVLAETFQTPLENIPAELAFGGLPQWDSMGHMGLMLALEERYGVEISAETIAELTSLAAIQAYLKEKDHE